MCKLNLFSSTENQLVYLNYETSNTWTPGCWRLAQARVWSQLNDLSRILNSTWGRCLILDQELSKGQIVLFRALMKQTSKQRAFESNQTSCTDTIAGASSCWLLTVIIDDTGNSDGKRLYLLEATNSESSRTDFENFSTLKCKCTHAVWAEVPRLFPLFKYSWQWIPTHGQLPGNKTSFSGYKINIPHQKYLRKHCFS